MQQAQAPGPSSAPAGAATKSPPSQEAVKAQTEHDEHKPAPGVSFDFGFSGGESAKDKNAPAEDDPIADLITAELDAADSEADAPTEPTVKQDSPSHASPQPIQAAARPAAVPIKPISVTPRGAESDRFTVAPVFAGVSKQPAELHQAVPSASGSSVLSTHISERKRDEEVDPIDEIESLIGEAVRVELTPSEKPQSAPVVPPLSTSFAPRRTAIKDAGNHAQSAEDAIIAAAAASGAEVGRIETPDVEDRPYKRMKVKPPKTSFISSGARQYVGIAVAATLLLASGFGLYWVLGMGAGSDPATAPVLTADASPAKVEPTVTPQATAEPSRSVVFDEIDGVAAAGEDETLVSRDDTAGATVAEVARAVVPAVEESTETGLANRKVRTVTVRPDGTIVSGDDAVAGSEALPVDRPNVPEIGGETLEPSELLTAAVAESEQGGTVVSTDAPADPTDPIAALVAETGDATTVPLDEPEPLDVAALDPEVSAVFDGSLVAPRPMPRPSNRSALLGGSTVTSEPTPTVSVNEPAGTPLVAVATQPQATASTNTATRSSAYVQMASLPSESDAQSQIRSQTARFGGLFNGTQLEVRRVDLGAKGVWYRVVLPVSSFQEATQTCATIKANGGDCFPNNG